MKPIGTALLAAALLALTATSAFAQYVVSAKSGTVNFTEGRVQLDGQPVELSPSRYPIVKEGSVLATGEGRAEVLLTPGVTLRLGDRASFKMIASRLIDTRLDLLGGSAVVEADAIAKDTSVTIVVNGAAVSLPKAGIYRFDFDPARVRVFKGEAAVQAGAETTLVGAGRTCSLGGTTAAVDKFKSEDADALDHWSHRRAELMAMANVSSANPLSSSGGWYSANYLGAQGTPFAGCGGYAGSMMPGFGYGFLGSLFFMNGGCQPNGLWSYNPWYDMFTYLPYGGAAYSPYGYTYSAPVTATVPVRKQPVVTGGGPVRRPVYGPTRNPMALAARNPMALAARSPLTLAVNGFRASGFHGGTAMMRSFGAPSHASYSGFTNSGYVGSVGSTGYVGSTDSVGSTRSASISGSTAASSGSGGIGMHGGGTASSGAVSNGGSHR